MELRAPGTSVSHRCDLPQIRVKIHGAECSDSNEYLEEAKSTLCDLDSFFWLGRSWMSLMLEFSFNNQEFWLESTRLASK